MLKNIFEELGVSVEASAEEVRGAYRHLAKQHHPDKVARTHHPTIAPISPEAAHERWVRIQTAYDLLIDDEKRAEHRSALLAEWNSNRTGTGAVLTENGWLLPGGRG